MNTRSHFRQWCADNRLRYATTEDGTPCSPTRSRKHPGDHLWMTPDAGFIGITVVRESERSLTSIVTALELLGASVRQKGVLEANLYATPSAAIGIALKLKTQKTAHKAPAMGAQ